MTEGRRTSHSDAIRACCFPQRTQGCPATSCAMVSDRCRQTGEDRYCTCSSSFALQIGPFDNAGAQKPLGMYFFRKAYSLYQDPIPKELSPSFWESEDKSSMHWEGFPAVLPGIEHELGGISSSGWHIGRYLMRHSSRTAAIYHWRHRRRSDVLPQTSAAVAICQITFCPIASEWCCFTSLAPS